MMIDLVVARPKGGKMKRSKAWIEMWRASVKRCLEQKGYGSMYTCELCKLTRSNPDEHISRRCDECLCELYRRDKGILDTGMTPCYSIFQSTQPGGRMKDPDLVPAIHDHLRRILTWLDEMEEEGEMKQYLLRDTMGHYWLWYKKSKNDEPQLIGPWVGLSTNF